MNPQIERPREAGSSADSAATLVTQRQGRESGTPTVRARTHIRALDGLRGLAILLVLLHHLFLNDYGGFPLLRAAYDVFRAGWVGVDLFFVLSGFLITGILIETRDKGRYFVNFYARRVLRIFPLYYGLLVVGVVVALLMPSVSGSFWHEQPWLWTYTSNIPIGRADSFVAMKASWLDYGPFWSLAVEEHFYLVWPFLVYVCPRKWLLRVCLGLATASIAARLVFVLTTLHMTSAYVLTPFRVDGLLVGSACAIVVRSERLFARVRRFAPALLAVTALGIAAFHFKTGWVRWNPAVPAFGFALLTTFGGAFVIVLADQSNRRIRTAMESSVLRFLGKYSYGIYAINLSVLQCLEPPLLGPVTRICHSTMLGRLAVRIIQAGVTIALAWIIYNLYEKHFLKLKRFFPEPLDPASGGNIAPGTTVLALSGNPAP